MKYKYPEAEIEMLDKILQAFRNDKSKVLNFVEIGEIAGQEMYSYYLEVLHDKNLIKKLKLKAPLY